MTAFKFYWIWFKLGRAYWKSRHLWTMMAYLDCLQENLAPRVPESMGDEMAAWLAAREDEEDAA